MKIEEKLPEDIDWSNYIDDYNSPGRTSFESEDKEAPRYEAFIAQKELLSSHLLWQFLMTSPSLEEEKIGSLIIGNLNKNGFLEVSIEELAETGRRRGGSRPKGSHGAAGIRSHWRLCEEPAGKPFDPGEILRLRRSGGNGYY